MKQSIFVHTSLVASCLFCISGIASADYESTVLSLNPSHYWKLNETTVNTVTPSVIDSAGSITGQHGGFFDPGEGAAGVPGPPVDISPGNVAFFANNIASIDLGPGTALAASTMTFAGWFTENGSEGGDRLWTNNQTDPNTSFQIFFGGGSGEVAANIGIGLNPAQNGFPVSGLPSGPNVGNFHIPESTVAVKDGQWHHIVASRNGNNIEDVIVVIDGVNYGPDTWRDSTDTWGTTGSNAQIATRTPGDGGGSQHVINGSVDEVAIWLGRQLTVAESIALYQSAISNQNPGDFDGDGDVDGNDFLVWQRDLNVGSLSDWQNGFGTPLAAAVASVPEPTGYTLLVLFGLGLARRRNRKA